jgi:3-oxoacyl-[acyl-carrier protein] reductase
MANQRLAQLSKQLGANLSGALLLDQVAIITGSGQGIGRAAALLFAQHGAKVVVADLDSKRADEVTKEITDAGGEALAFPCNVMDPDFGDKVVKATIEKFGKINHLVK